MRTLSISFIKKFFDLHFGGSRRAPQLRLHKEDPRGDGDSATKTAQPNVPLPPYIPVPPRLVPKAKKVPTPEMLTHRHHSLYHHTSVEKPPYYSPVDIWVNGKLLEDWHRLSDEDDDFYGNSRDSRIIFDDEVEWWCERPGVKYPKYEPMTDTNESMYTQHDINSIIRAMGTLISLSNDPDYTEGVSDALDVILNYTNTPRTPPGNSGKYDGKDHTRITNP